MLRVILTVKEGSPLQPGGMPSYSRAAFDSDQVLLLRKRARQRVKGHW